MGERFLGMEEMANTERSRGSRWPHGCGGKWKKLFFASRAPGAWTLHEIKHQCLLRLRRICFSCPQPPMAGFPLPRCTPALCSTRRQGWALGPPPAMSWWTGRKPKQLWSVPPAEHLYVMAWAPLLHFCNILVQKKSPSAASSAGVGHRPLHIAAWDMGRTPTSAWGEPAGGFIRMELVQIVLKISKSNNGVCI